MGWDESERCRMKLNEMALDCRWWDKRVYDGTRRIEVGQNEFEAQLARSKQERKTWTQHN